MLEQRRQGDALPAVAELRRTARSTPSASSSPTRRRSSGCPTAAPTSARSATSASRPRCCSGGAATARTAACPSSCSCTSRPGRRPRRSACSTAALLAPGYRGDVNVIDFDGLRLHTPEFRYDLPAGGRRVIQRADGYLHTFVAGTEIRERRRVDRRHAGPPGPRRPARPGGGQTASPVRAASAGRSTSWTSAARSRRTCDRCRWTAGEWQLPGSGGEEAVDLGRGTSARPARRSGCGCGSAATRAGSRGSATPGRGPTTAARAGRRGSAASSVGQSTLRREVGDVDLGERLEEAHGVVRRRRAPLQLVELLPLLAGAVGQELRREHLAERRVVATPPDAGDLEVEGGLPPLLLGRRPHAAGPGRRRRAGSSRDTRSGWRAAKATATAAPWDTPSSGNRSSPAASTTSSRSSTQSSNRKLVDVPVRHPAAPLVVADAACGRRRGPPASAARRTSRGRGRGGSASSPP